MIHDTDQQRHVYLPYKLLSMSQLVTKGPTYSHVVTEDPAHQCDRGFFSTNFMSNARWKCSNTEQVLQETSPSLSLWAESRVMTNNFCIVKMKMNGCGAAAAIICAYRRHKPHQLSSNSYYLVILVVVVVVIKMIEMSL